MLASRLGWDKFPKVLEFCHPLLPPPTFPGERRRRNKKKEVKWRGGEGWGGWGGKGRKESQTHGRVWSGGEQREARHQFFFYACTSLHLGFLGYYCAITTSHFSELFKIYVTSFPSKKNQSEL